MSNKEAVEAAYNALVETLGGWASRKTAEKLVAAARPFMLEEDARRLEALADAMDEKAEAIRAQGAPFDPATSNERDAAVTAFEFRRAAAAIRAAKETGG